MIYKSPLWMHACVPWKSAVKKETSNFFCLLIIFEIKILLDFNVLINVLTNEFNVFEDYIMADCFDSKPNILITNKSDRGLSYDRYVPRIIILWNSNYSNNLEIVLKNRDFWDVCLNFWLFIKTSCNNKKIDNFNKSKIDFNSVKSLNMFIGLQLY